MKYEMDGTAQWRSLCEERGKLQFSGASGKVLIGNKDPLSYLKRT